MSKGPVRIGNDVWIGSDAYIGPGITIGDGAVVGARAVVTRDVQPYEIVAGVPAQRIRLRFSEQIITELLSLSWWDWPDDLVDFYLPLILSPNIGLFIATAQSDLKVQRLR